MSLQKGCTEGNSMLTVQARLRNVPHRVLDSPDDAVHKEFELRGRDRKKCFNQCNFVSAIRYRQDHVNHTGEAVEVNRAQELEEPYSVFGILREVLINHVQSRLKDSFKNWQNLRGKK